MNYPPMPYPDWQRPLFDALMEFNRHKLSEKIRVAELAIRERLKDSRSLSNQETLALRDGLNMLSALMPQWNGERNASGEGRNASDDKTA